MLFLTNWAARFLERVVALADEFAAAEEPKAELFGFAGAVYKVAT